MVGLRSGVSGPEMGTGSGLSAEQVQAWVHATCAAQGVAVKIMDGAVLRRVGVLLGVDTAGSGASGAASEARAPRRASR